MLRQNEELNHATTYCRFLEEELFSARKKEKDKGKGKVLDKSRLVLARNGYGGGHGGYDGVIAGVTSVGGSVAGKTLGAFLGVGRSKGKESENFDSEFEAITRVNLNFGSDFGIDGQQDILPWVFNPMLSMDGEEKSTRYAVRERCALLRGEYVFK